LLILRDFIVSEARFWQHCMHGAELLVLGHSRPKTRKLYSNHRNNPHKFNEILKTCVMLQPQSDRTLQKELHYWPRGTNNLMIWTYVNEFLPPEGDLLSDLNSRLSRRERKWYPSFEKREINKR
jgi:hypothetical protein